MLNTVCLVVIAASLCWGLVLRDPVVAWWRLRAQRQRTLAASLELPPAPQPPPEIPAMQLLLCHGAQVEHEITLHVADAPEGYAYAGKTYRQEKRRHRPDPHDVVWEYQR